MLVTECIFAARCCGSAAYAVMRCPYIRLSISHILTFCQNE